MGQVRWAWPGIQAALAAGHTLHLVHKRLNEAGIGIGYRTLSLYIGRLEREQAVGRTHDVTAARHAEKMASPGVSRPRVGVARAEQSAHDPFSNIRREREKKKGTGFEYDAFSTNKNLLE
jgi:spermidine synthase